MATTYWVTGIRPTPEPNFLNVTDPNLTAEIWQMRCVSMREAGALIDALGTASVLSKLQVSEERPTEYDRRTDGLWNRIEIFDRMDSQVTEYYPVFEVSDQESYDLWDRLYEWRTTHVRDTGTAAAFEFNCKIYTGAPDAEDMMEVLGDGSPEWFDGDPGLIKKLNEAWGRSVDGLLDTDRASFKEECLYNNKSWLKEIYFTGRSGGWATFVTHSAWWDSGWPLQDFTHKRLEWRAAWASNDYWDGDDDDDELEEDFNPWWPEEFWWWHTVAERLERIKAEIESYTHNWGNLEKNREYWIEEFDLWLERLDEAVYNEVDQPAALRNRILIDWGRY